MDPVSAIAYITGRLEEELPRHLTYHGPHHTLDVLEATERVARQEGIADEELNLVLVAAAFHDCGFLISHIEHEQTGCEIARTELPRFGYDKETIEAVCRMIMATKVPQTPFDRLSRVLCDADLDYLGRDDFGPIAHSLFEELRHLGIVNDEQTWNRIQVKFLNAHRYHTAYSNQERGPVKQEHLSVLEDIVAGYAV